MRILVTNDDGIDAPGLRAVVERLRTDHDGELMVVAPHTEQSGMGAALGPFYLNPPRVHERHLDGVELEQCWSIEGPPSLGVLLARLGAFGEPPDLVVSGVNPGLNVGRAVYHSGTIGATLTARNGHIHGIAISQEMDPSIGLHPQHWDTATEIAARAVRAMVTSPPPEASVLNLNVPDRPIGQLRGIRSVPVGDLPPRRALAAQLLPLGGGVHEIELEASDEASDTAILIPDHDTGAVAEGWVAMSWLGRIVHDDPGEHGVEDALEAFFAER